VAFAHRQRLAERIEGMRRAVNTIRNEPETAAIRTINLTVLAAILAVIGYSLNDTIVIYDRIRENFRLMRVGGPIEVANKAINQTMSRTIMTGVTTLLVLIALFYFGGEVIHGFALALIIGVLVGTYSSIYVASALALMIGLTKEDLLPLKEKEPVDDMP
jgi:preprotein translocase subunit SecF